MQIASDRPHAYIFRQKKEVLVFTERFIELLRSQGEQSNHASMINAATELESDRSHDPAKKISLDKGNVFILKESPLDEDGKPRDNSVSNVLLLMIRERFTDI